MPIKNNIYLQQRSSATAVDAAVATVDSGGGKGCNFNNCLCFCCNNTNRKINAKNAYYDFMEVLMHRISNDIYDDDDVGVAVTGWWSVGGLHSWQHFM